MLELTKRASVNEHFLTLAFHIYEQWMENEEKNARTYPAGAEVYRDRNAMRHARIINLLHGGDGDGRSGKQYEVTKLRVLPFTEFSAISHGGTPYLVGQTKPIVINVGVNSRRIPEGDYHLGAYRIYIPPSVILKGNIDYIHMVPVKAPFTENRFMHHRAYEEGDHYLDYRTSTCWGNFGTTIKPLAVDADIPELFRGLFLYLSRYNIASPLVNINNMGWDVTTPWEEFCREN